MKEVGKNYCDTSKLSIRKISKSVAKDIVIKNHYSHLWTKVSYAIGLYIEDDSHQFFNTSEKLIGVACYGDPIGRLSGQSITPLLDRTEVLELVRVFVFDDYGSNIESWFLGQSFKWLKKNAPQIKGLISYSDPKEGHAGTIYQATNWIYQGCGSFQLMPTYSLRLNEEDDWMHSRNVYSMYGSNNLDKMKKAIGHDFWLKRETTKHRYIYFLGNKKENRNFNKILKHPSMDYPKDTKFIDEVIKVEVKDNKWKD